MSNCKSKGIDLYGIAVVLGYGEARELDGLEVVLAPRRRVADAAQQVLRRLIGHRCGPVGEMRSWTASRREVGVSVWTLPVFDEWSGTSLFKF
jgi:hypothetical protein